MFANKNHQVFLKEAPLQLGRRVFLCWEALFPTRASCFSFVLNKRCNNNKKRGELLDQGDVNKVSFCKNQQCDKQEALLSKRLVFL
jgi:hypothetical protein